ncbi:MAG TPA: YihY/virulence factor BrkB family protein, partial [Verrucomicrobiae bacterium]|nr:YihY/virulence factor BrkB family protein [Verrucomicrobiae bacterium]
MNKWLAKSKRAVGGIRDFLDEKGLASANRAPLSRLHRFAHFWLMVARSFSRNRCPLRAAALAYTTLLALIPVLAVALSVSTLVLKKEGKEQISGFIDKLVDSVTPPVAISTNSSAGASTQVPGSRQETSQTNGSAAAPQTNSLSSAGGGTNDLPASGPPNTKYLAARKQVADVVHEFIQNSSSGALGVTGSVLLVFVAISMLSRIEETFNDIWGVSRGRSWFMRIVQYWAVITLGPILLVSAAALTSGPHLWATRHLLGVMPVVGRLVFQLLPVAILCLSFCLFYMCMPNTKVHLQAALVGGLVGGVLWHLNNYFSVLYVSRWISNSKIYGSLAMIPVIMVGLYFSWLILLFGAQVAYAYQNRATYLQEKQSENINQRGREFVALRLMQCVGQRFLRGERPANVAEIADGLAVPTGLIQQ